MSTLNWPSHGNKKLHNPNTEDTGILVQTTITFSH